MRWAGSGPSRQIPLASAGRSSGRYAVSRQLFPLGCGYASVLVYHRRAWRLACRRQPPGRRAASVRLSSASPLLHRAWTASTERRATDSAAPTTPTRSRLLLLPSRGGHPASTRPAMAACSSESSPLSVHHESSHRGQHRTRAGARAPRAHAGPADRRTRAANRPHGPPTTKLRVAPSRSIKRLRVADYQPLGAVPSRRRCEDDRLWAIRREGKHAYAVQSFGALSTLHQA